MMSDMFSIGQITFGQKSTQISSTDGIINTQQILNHTIFIYLFKGSIVIHVKLYVINLFFMMLAGGRNYPM